MSARLVASRGCLGECRRAARRARVSEGRFPALAWLFIDCDCVTKMTFDALPAIQMALSLPVSRDLLPIESA